MVARFTPLSANHCLSVKPDSGSGAPAEKPSSSMSMIRRSA
jgi:hypothetical protein